MVTRKNELWYVSQPSRLGGSGKEEFREQVLRELITQGYDVIHPFNAFPYDHFEGNKAIGRDMAMKYCCDLVDMCAGRVIVTGISEGVLFEIEHALQNHHNAQIKVYPQFDPEWHTRVRQFDADERYQRAITFVRAELNNPVESAQ